MKKKLLSAIFILMIIGSAPTKANAQEAFLAEVKLFAGNFAPRGWMKCEGQLLPISQYSALFSLLGTIYGGDGRTTFALPDMRGRVAVGVGNGPGLSPVREGQKHGAETATITINQLPSHEHNLENVTEIDIKTSPGNNNNNNNDSKKALSPVATGGSTTVTTTNTGGSQAISIKPPSLGMIYIICVQGIFPSRS